jgi:hypothetical protein
MAWPRFGLSIKTRGDPIIHREKPSTYSPIVDGDALA